MATEEKITAHVSPSEDPMPTRPKESWWRHMWPVLVLAVAGLCLTTLSILVSAEYSHDVTKNLLFKFVCHGREVSVYRIHAYWFCFCIVGIASIIPTLVLAKRDQLKRDQEFELTSVKWELRQVTREADQRRRQLNDLQEALDQQRILILEQFRDCLQLQARQFGLTRNERVTVYLYKGDHFINIVRYSEHPTYIKNGRARYPEDEGMIAKAWENGEAYEVIDTKYKNKRYNEQLRKRLNITADVADRLTMKARCHAAFVIRDLGNKKNIGVIVFESVSPNGIDYEKIKKAMREIEGERIARLLESCTVISLEPQPVIAAKEGF